MMFWKKRLPIWRAVSEPRTTDIEGGMRPMTYLATQGAYRGILGAFIGSIVFMFLYILLGRISVSSLLYQFDNFIGTGCFCCGLNLFTAIPAAIGGMLLAMWLFRDAKKGVQSTKKSILRGALVGCCSGLIANAGFYLVFMLLPAHNITIHLLDTVYFILVSARYVLPAGFLGGAYAGWILAQDIQNGYLYGYL